MERRTVVLAVVAVLAVGTAGCNKLAARDKLNKGVHAYKAGTFDRAIELFKEAKDLDPDLINARLYLATAYATQYIPGAPSEENTRNGQQAVEEFKKVLEKDADNLNAIDGLGSILFNMAGTPFSREKFDESKSYHSKHIQIKPDDPEPYYWIGVINWTLAYRTNGELRKNYNENARKRVNDTDPLPDKVRQQFEQEMGALVQEGIEHLDKAIRYKSDYDAAYAYLNLLYRQKADMAANANEREELLAKADQLVEKFKEIKQRQLEQSTGAGVAPGE